MTAPRLTPLRTALFPLLLALAGTPAALAAQSVPNASASELPPPIRSADASGSPFGNSGADPEQNRMLHKMFKERNALRQHTIVDDTNRLLELAQQLKDAVDKSNKDQLSLEVVNTASEIEKLARSVKEKMRDGQ